METSSAAIGNAAVPDACGAAVWIDSPRGEGVVKPDSRPTPAGVFCKDAGAGRGLGGVPAEDVGARSKRAPPPCSRGIACTGVVPAATPSVVCGASVACIGDMMGVVGVDPV
jgi:hypothetical protein